MAWDRRMGQIVECTLVSSLVSASVSFSSSSSFFIPFSFDSCLFLPRHQPRSVLSLKDLVRFRALTTTPRKPLSKLFPLLIWSSLIANKMVRI